MRHIDRLPEPPIITQNHATWTAEYLASSDTRPLPRRYGHQGIREVLIAMSIKCYYCERQLKGVTKEIDHFIEVTERRDLAYTWSNLYLSCSNCNKKLPNTTIPVADVLDPCTNTNDEIKACITFDEEIIRMHNNSEKGKQTIGKYRLDTEVLDHQRCKAIKEFYRRLSEIKGKMAEEHRAMNQIELEEIKSYAYLDHPFSLMFEVLIAKLGY